MDDASKRFVNAASKLLQGLLYGVAGLGMLGIGLGVLALLLSGAFYAYSEATWSFSQTDGLRGPWGVGLRVAAGLALLLAYLGAVAYVVAWAFSKGWNPKRRS